MKNTKLKWGYAVTYRTLALLAVILLAAFSISAAQATVLLQGDQNTSPNFNSGSINTSTLWTVDGDAPGGAITEPGSSYAQFNAGATSPGHPRLISQLTTSPTTAGLTLSATIDIPSITNSNPVNEIPYWGFNTGLSGSNILIYDGGTNGWCVWINNTSTSTSNFFDLSSLFPTKPSAEGTWQIIWSTSSVVVDYNGSPIFNSATNDVTSGSNAGTTNWNIPTVDTHLEIAAQGGNAAGDDLMHLNSAILQTVPEPSAAVLGGLGVLALMLTAKFRRASRVG